MTYDNYNNFPWSIWILVIIIITAGVVATAAILIDFDDCLHHHEYGKWGNNIWFVQEDTLSTLILNSRNWWNVIFIQINSPLPKSIYENAWPIMMDYV